MAASALDHACHSAPQVTGQTPLPAGSPSPIGPFQVTYSGESILFSPQDAQGNPLAITGVRSADDVQVLGLVGVPAASSFTLSLLGQATAPIALQPAPPLTSFAWSATLPAAGSYDLSYFWGYAYGSPATGALPACAAAVIEVHDGPTVVGTITLDQTKYPDPTVDLNVPGTGVFRSLGTFAFATTSLRIILAGPSGSGSLLAGTMRVVPHGSTAPTAVGYIDPSPNPQGNTAGSLQGETGTTRYGNWTLDYDFTNGDGSGRFQGCYFAPATGTQATGVPAPADVQAALLKLAAVPAGAVVVAAVTNQVCSIHFTGALSEQTVATLVSSNPALRVTHDNTGGSSVGGQLPQVSVNGASYPLRASSFATTKPTMMFHLVQDAPAVQYFSCGEGLFSGGGGALLAGGLSGVIAELGAGAVASCTVQGLVGPADFEVDLTWPAGDPAADLVQVTVLDAAGNTLATMAQIDQSRPPASFPEAGVGWQQVGRFHLATKVNGLTITITSAGTPNKHGIVDSIRLARVSAPQSVRIAPTDVVTFSAPAAFIYVSSGPLPAAVSLAVAPAGASRLPALGSRTRTMKLGYNCNSPNYFQFDSLFSNWHCLMG